MGGELIYESGLHDCFLLILSNFESFFTIVER